MKKLLIANRGEIAVRIIRAAREMGIASVAVYSDADREAMHKKLADEAVHIGPSEPSASYLNMERVIAAAKEVGADAIHPGYGFLSERAEFAELCSRNGLIFVGPSASSMRRLGAKSDAKTLAVQESVPIVPGLFESGATQEQMKAAASEIGYPVMLKASAGGGGRGMRVVRRPEDFDNEFRVATDEALKGFGDGSMMVEKLVERPLHIEVQLLADQHGNVAVLFERECSLQRRHQKILEEAPSGVWNEELKWEEMRAAAIRLAKAAGYVGAGTVEFMIDPASNEFYFLEVNTRLQVEHPVTETITGIDLVKWQLRIADGEHLDIPADLYEGRRSAINGHAIEARIVAEDPAANFLPSVGKIVGWAEPRGPGVRFDTGYEDGAEVSRFYDSLIGKVIVHGDTRQEAVERLRKALLDLHILGVQTNVEYLLDVLEHPSFLAADVDTGFLGREFGDWKPSEPPKELFDLLEFVGGSAITPRGELTATAWSSGDGFRNARA